MRPHISPPIYNGVRIVNRPDLENVWRIDRGAMPMISAMETNGMRVDSSHIVNLHGLLVREMESLAAKVVELAGCDPSTNLGSADQLAKLLFDDLGLKQPGKEKRTKKTKRLQVDSDILTGMLCQHACIGPLLEWKVREKLRSTYTYSLIKQADEYDRIHCDLNQTGPETGRLSSSDPNLQNIPVRTTLGQEVRNAFVPSQGMVLGTVDASQIEMRGHAHDSQDKALLEVFWQWEDLYWATAEGMYERKFTPDQRKNEIEPVTGLPAKEYFRFNAKTTTLAVSYDITPPGLVDQFLASKAVAFLTDGELIWNPEKHLDKAIEKCSALIIKWFRLYGGVMKRRIVHHKRAMLHGLVWDMWGRVRWIPQVNSAHKWIVQEGLRQAGNMPVQGLAAGIIKLWMAVIWDRIQSYWGRFGIRPLMQIHDELLFEGPQQPLLDFLEETKHIIRNLLPCDYFTVPLEAESGIGERWGGLKH